MGKFLVDDGEKVILDNWGGSQIYYKNNKKFVVVRDCGLFSNFTVVLYGIFILTINGYEIDDLEIEMTDYFRGVDIYPILYKKNNSILSFDDLNNNDIKFFEKYCYPTVPLGLGLNNHSNIPNKETFNLEITKRVVEKFFTPSDEVNKLLYEMMLSKKISENDYVFVWARKTDKIEETKLPSAETYFETLKSNDLLNEKIIIQTDDFSLFEDFNKLNFKFDYFSEIPFADKYSFHRWVHSFSDNEFYERYKLSKEDYVRNMLCVVLLSAKAKKTIIYPGNPTIVVPIYKNTFENCILFRDDLSII